MLLRVLAETRGLSPSHPHFKKTAFPAKNERSLSKKQGQLMSKCGKAANVNQLQPLPRINTAAGQDKARTNVQK